MLIYGVHACQTAIRSKKREILRVYLLAGKHEFPWLSEIPKSKISYVSLADLECKLPNHAVHQGIAMDVEAVRYADIEDLKDAPKNCVVAILDGVTDPHNLGAIIRTAATFGVVGIILPERSSCKITGVVAKTASGGLEYVDIYIVKNLSQTIEKLKLYGFWVVSFCERGGKFLHEVDLGGKVCLMFGAEGDGIRRLPREHSDFVVKLPTTPNFPTLNVSASAAIAFYEASKQKFFN